MLRTHKNVVLALLIAFSCLLVAGPTLAQDRPGRGGDDGDQPRMTREQWENMSDEEREAFRDQMREQMAQRQAERQAERDQQTREALDMSEEEWGLIGPMINAIQQMQREEQVVSSGQAFGGRGGQQGNRGGRGGDNADRGDRGGPELSEAATAIQAASTELRELLEDDASTAAELKDALKQLRDARTALSTTITAAQEDLRGLLTTRQEAQLVAQGVLN